MKVFFLIICSIILPVLCLKKTTPKLCVNCKFFINSVTCDNKYGKCSLFPKKENSIDFLVSGVVDDTYYSFCSTARTYDNMCGKEGKKYENKPSKNAHLN
jgi:hypothetical protein